MERPNNLDANGDHVSIVQYYCQRRDRRWPRVNYFSDTALTFLLFVWAPFSNVRRVSLFAWLGNSLREMGNMGWGMGGIPPSISVSYLSVSRGYIGVGIVVFSFLKETKDLLRVQRTRIQRIIRNSSHSFLIIKNHRLSCTPIPSLHIFRNIHHFTSHIPHSTPPAPIRTTRIISNDGRLYVQWG